MDSMQLQSETHDCFWVKTNKLLKMFIWKYLRPRIAKIIQKNKARGFSLSDFKIHFKTTEMKTPQIWFKYKQYNSRVNITEIDSFIYSEMIYKS